MKASSLSLRETQDEALNILRFLDCICEKLHLRYWLMYGSLIGAVRHHGFIPWDDDLDVAMPRDDFNKLVTHFTANVEEFLPLVLLDYSTYEQGLPFLIARLSNTSFRQIGEYGDAVPEMGAFIDIYPFDGMGNDLKEACVFKKRCEKHIKGYMDTFFFKTGHHYIDSLRRIKKKIVSARIGNPHYHLMQLAREIKTYSYSDSLYIGNCTWNYGFPNDFYYKEDFENLIRVEFEGFMAPIPIGYNRVLSSCYGEYMQLPPENERVGHHYYSIVRRP